jgi:hypothetical protein
MKWAIGLTTVPQRRDSLLPRTLLSLRKAGFDQRIRLLVDGLRPENVCQWSGASDLSGCDISARWPKIGAYPSWLLGLTEVFLRDPTASRYMMCQDDFVCCRSLRAYLSTIDYPSPTAYLNLYTFPRNQALCPRRDTTRGPNTGDQLRGWYPSDQRGLGAVALIFCREAVLQMLTSQPPYGPLLPEQPCSPYPPAPVVPRTLLLRPSDDPERGLAAIDGGIAWALRLAGWTEYVHNPSLVQHVGHRSTLGNAPHPQALSFPGEDFDAMTL